MSDLLDTADIARLLEITRKQRLASAVRDWRGMLFGWRGLIIVCRPRIHQGLDVRGVACSRCRQL